VKDAITLENVTFSYQRHAKKAILDGVSLRLEAGKAYLLTGSSGSGKSTLLSVASGLCPENAGFLESGERKVFGKDIEELNKSERAKLVSMLFQNADLQFTMSTLYDECVFALENICTEPKLMDGIIAQNARKMGTEPLLRRDFWTLSGGEKQKAALTVLFCLGSKIIMLDEAFSNIDEDSAREMIAKLLKWKSEDEERTIIALDHRLGLWSGIVDETLIFRSGGKGIAKGITKENFPSFKGMLIEEGIIREAHAHERKKGEEGIALSLRGVTLKRDGKILLDGASATFRKGEVTLISGPSGAGKTSLLLSLLKECAIAGEVRLFGKDISKMRKREIYGLVGIVFQNPQNQFVSQCVKDEVLASLNVWGKGLSNKEKEEKANKELSAFGLGNYWGKSPYMLSQGEQRRLAVVTVLVGGQKLLLLDEPTYGQDGATSERILSCVREKCDEDGISAIVVSHDTEVAKEFSDRAYELKDGKLLEKECDD